MIIEQRALAPLDTELPPPTTPRTAEKSPDSDAISGPAAWGSPAFLKPGWSSYGGNLDTAYDSFIEEDGFVSGKGRKKPRYSLHREDWRVLDEPDSPREREGTVDWDQMIEDELDTEPPTGSAADTQLETEPRFNEAIAVETPVEIENVPQEQPAIFVKPSLEQAGSRSARRTPQSIHASPLIEANRQDPFGLTTQLPTDTPQLRPIPSPGLPVPSPIISNSNAQEYFAEFLPVSHTPITQSLDTRTYDPAHLAHGSMGDMPQAAQRRTSELFVEELEVSELRQEPIPMEGVASTAASAAPTAFIDSPTFDEHPEFRESDIEMVDKNPPGQLSALGNDAFGRQETEVMVEVEGEIDSMGAEETKADEMDAQEMGAEDSEYDEEVGMEEELPERMSPMQEDHLRRDEFYQDHGIEHEEISDENEALSDEENAENMSDDDNAEYEEFRLAQRSHSKVAEPEVIVLDSDSEDELVSKQPMSTPSQPSRHEDTLLGPLTQATTADWAKDAEDDWSAVDEESDNDGLDHEDQLDGYGRVHDINLEDESSVDEEDSTHADSDEQGQDDEIDDSYVGEEEGEFSDEDAERNNKTGFTPATAIDLDADSDEHEPASDEDGFPKERELSEHDEDDSFPHPTRAPRGLDGTDDRSIFRQHPQIEVDRPTSSDRATTEIEGPPGQSLEGISVVQTTTTSLPETSTFTSVELGPDQLLTPVATQEVVPDRHVFPIRTKSEAPTAINTRARLLSPVETAEAAIETPDLPTQTRSTSRQVPEPELHNAVQTTEPLPGVEEHDDHLAAPTAPTVLVRKPVPDRHAHGLRSKLSYFAPLATLVDHYNALIDTISVVNEIMPIAKAASGSKDYYMTIQLTDPSMAGTTLQAQIFRRYKSAIPALSEGSVILLRNFKVRSFDHSIMLVSVDSSAWAVFDGSSPEAQMNGPPVEYGSDERAYVSDLRRWYCEVGESMVADNKLQASIERESLDRELTPSDVASSEVGSIGSASRGDSVQSTRGSRRSRKRHRRVTIHELRDGTRYTEVGSPSSRESIHELRDGTVYANL